MIIKSLGTKCRILLLSVIVVIVGIILQNNIKYFYNSIISRFALTNNKLAPGVYSQSQLLEYNGIKRSKLYLAVLGRVFDVTKGSKHYKKGSPYNYFIGKDGSKALVTGNFKDESEDKDHVIDLSCDEIFTLIHWRDTFKQKYVPVGVLHGRYFDENGKVTAYSKQLNKKINECKKKKEVAKQQELRYPPCNMLWSVDEGTKVWCTKMSGGVDRDWVGVPHQLYTPGKEKPRCVCVNLDNLEDSSQGLLKRYKHCLSETSCTADSD